MNILNPSKLLTRSLIGTVGLTAIAFLGVPVSVEAASIWRGSDYLATPGGGTTVFDFGGPIGNVSFTGNPFGPGNTDTIVQRKQDCILPVVGSFCTIDIEMVALSLKSEDPVNIGGTDFNVFVGLDPSNASTGSMTINHDFPDNFTPEAEGTFSSVLDVFFRAELVEIGGNGSNDFFVDEFVTMTVDNALWSHEPAPGTLLVRGAPGTVIGDNLADQRANCHSQDLGCPLGVDRQGNPVGDFFPGVNGDIGLVQHDASGAAKHGVVVATPEPLTILGSITALGLGVVFKRKGSKNVESNQV